MKLHLDEHGNQIYDIKNEKEYMKHCDLHTRLESAVEKTGNKALLSDNPTGVVLEAVKLLQLIQWSIMQYCQDSVTYKSGHKYGETL